MLHLFQSGGRFFGSDKKFFLLIFNGSVLCAYSTTIKVPKILVLSAGVYTLMEIPEKKK